MRNPSRICFMFNHQLQHQYRMEVEDTPNGVRILPHDGNNHVDCFAMLFYGAAEKEALMTLLQ